MIELPKEYIINCIFQYAGYPKIHRDGIVSAGCPSCREGKSWGKKQRLFYIPEYNNIHCKNCNRSWSPESWVIELSGKSIMELKDESKDFEYTPVDRVRIDKEFKKNPLPIPADSIDLLDPVQLGYYKNNSVVREARALVENRRLHMAINMPKSIYLSLTDYVHKDRLIIPFYNHSGVVEFYQSRSIYEKQTPKYLGQVSGTKTIYGENNISADLEYIFIFEGPIDAMFVKNGIAIAGIELSGLQMQRLKTFPFHRKIWVLDNQNIDKTSFNKSQRLLSEGESIFIWPKDIDVKDFNDIAIKSGVNEIPAKFILKHSFSGVQGNLMMSKLT